MKITGIIPARYASTRFPGKPLIDIGGKTMIQRVYEQAQKANKLTAVIVATDDDKIKNHVESFGGKVMMTASTHQSGTDRCFEAIQQFDKTSDAVINIQGDEPFIQPEQIDLLASCFENAATEIATLAKIISAKEDIFNPNVPKVILNTKNEAIYFSRHGIPFFRNAPEDEWINKHTYYKHIGIYGYKTSILGKITALKQSPLELAESLEQLRWIENGYKINVKITDFESVAVDVPDDLKKLAKFL